jgi:prephenate dehydrogenase
MASDKIIYYDREFIKKFEELKALLETGDRQQIYQFLLKEFQFIFKLNQYYWKQIAESNAQEFLEEEEEIRQELMRPLSHRQYRMIERSFSRWLEEEDHVIWSIWDFLHDNDRIYQKKVMSSAEVGGCSMILENVYSCLARKTVKDK